MPKASDITPDRNISFLFKSSPGGGKTIAACSLAEYGPIYLAYFDKRVPIEVFTYFKKIGREDILENITYDIYGSHNVNEYLNKLYKFCIDYRYIGIITDSTTQLTSSAVNWSLGFDGKRDEKRIEIPDWDEYKVLTTLVTQALDLTKSYPGYNIWTAHPVSRVNVTGSGRNITVTKADSIVTYGGKIGDIIPGNFTEIYHFGTESEYSADGVVNRRICFTDNIGEDNAKTAFDLPKKIDFTNKLFFHEWKALIGDKYKEVV